MVTYEIIVDSETLVKIKLKGSAGSTSLVYLKALFCLSCSCLLKGSLTFLQDLGDSVL